MPSRIIAIGDIHGCSRALEVLLKEIHHRVKNNLQIINSLLYLQANGSTNEESIKALKESQSRVKSMAIGLIFWVSYNT